MTDAEWEEVVRALRDPQDAHAAVRAAEHLHRSATSDDVPRLVDLLQDASFFVREAAAWPLSELAGARYLQELLVAYQRGLDEGRDNDGFSAALADMAEANPGAITRALQPLLISANESMRSNASWLLHFCGKGT